MNSNKNTFITKDNQTSFTLLFPTTALILALSIFAALTFEAIHAGHEHHCHDEDCAICLVLQILHNTNKITGDAPFTPVESLAFFYTNIIILSALILVPATLVSQKIKLVI